ncbi:MAG: hypothetical protein IKC64_05645, partial [Clostridia bacterium]|nr:hypothetical protein [Clostridia bacterium]
MSQFLFFLAFIPLALFSRLIFALSGFIGKKLALPLAITVDLAFSLVAFVPLYFYLFFILKGDF